MNEFPADRNLGSDLHAGDLTHEDVGLPARAGVAALGGLGDSAQGAAGCAQGKMGCRHPARLRQVSVRKAMPTERLCDTLG